jgi:tryptophan halogenase
MNRSLSPSSRVRRDPAGQSVPLPDGRWLVRHAGGVSLLSARSVAVLSRVLPGLDQERSLEEICAGLAGDFEAEEVQRVLESVNGELIQVVEGPAAPVPVESVESAGTSRGSTSRGALRAVVLGGGPAAERVAESVEAFAAVVHVPAPGPGWEEGLREAALAVVCLDGASYAELLAIQKDCLTAGVPALFLTADPDGLRIGPTAVPGIGACLACAQLAAFGFLGREAGMDPGAVLETLSGFRTVAAEAGQPPSLDRALGALLGEAREILRPDGEPGLLTGAVLLPPAGGSRRLPVERQPACPLCAGIAAMEGRGEGSVAARAARVRVESEERRPARAFPDEPEGLVRTVGILGGGTAGYLAALALRRKLPWLSVSLIESSDVPIIGVGEATTPLMPQFLHVDLGLDIHRLFREVRPALKLGIRFLWGEPETGDFHYPFGPVHALEPGVYGGDPRDCSLQSLLMTAGAAPLYPRPGGGWTCGLGTEAAYHLDNERFVAYLQKRAPLAGVERIEATISGVEKSEDGEEVRALIATDGRRLSFDLYVDCSGFRSLLLEEALGSPWISFEKSLWTDRAVVGPVPHGGTVLPYTTAETLSAGWCWNTPQEDVDHRGYVFASAFQSPEEAEAEMRRTNPGMGSARLVRFRAGRHADFWKGNVVALGNAYGFVEPLESTALHMLIREIGLLVRSFPVRRGDRGLPALLNRKVGAWWDYLRWFLAIHYKFNRRVDSPFWRACREEVDVSSHAELLEAFRERGPLSYDPSARAAFDYPDPLWGPEGIDALLLGQGVPGRRPRPSLNRSAWDERLRLARATVARAVPHAEALRLLRDEPELLEAFVDAFRAAGPAYPVGPV